MKKIITFLLLFITLITNAQNNFSKGFSDGYKKGYCQDKGIGCIEPIAPIAPIPNVGEDLNNYQDGYNRGFKTGLQANSNNSSSTRDRYKTAKSEFIDITGSDNTNQELMLKLIELKQKQIQESQNSNLNNETTKREVVINSKEFAIINIYRPKKTMGSLLPVEVLVNGESVAQLYSGGHLEYKIYDLSAKSVTIKSAGIATINLMPSKDKIYYFETKPKFSGFTLEQITSPVPSTELKEKKYLTKSDYTF